MNLTRRVSWFGNPHKKSWEHSHLALVVFEAGDLNLIEIQRRVILSPTMGFS